MNPEKKSADAEPRRSSGSADASSTAEMVARRSYGKLVAFLAARTRDLAAAETPWPMRSHQRSRIGLAMAVLKIPKRGC